MDPVSAVASITTLVALAKEIATITTDVVNGVRSAPQELAQVQNNACLIFLNLKCMETALNQADGVRALDSDEAWIWHQALTVAKHNMTFIHEECKLLIQRRAGGKSRLVWAILEKKKAEGYLSQLQHTQNSLGVILQVISVKLTFKVFSQGDQRNKKLGSLRQLQPADPTWQRVTSSRSPRNLSVIRLSEFWRWLLACELFVLMSSSASQKRYDCYVRLTIPVIMGKVAIMMALSFQRPANTWSNLVIFGGRLHAVRYISEESDAVVACKKGDTLAVRDLFESGKASPNDMSVEGKSLIWYATQGGSIDLVEYLIDRGGTVTPGGFLAAAYWGQPAIARLCLRTGIDIEVMASNGHTAALCLFGSSRIRGSQSEFIELLGSKSFSLFDAHDSCGWTALHRAAAFGTREDVNALLRMKASANVLTYNLQWTPLSCAVCFGNVDAMQELWGCYENPSAMTDLRGWNLLHIAAGAGRFGAIPFLLDHGVDVKAGSKATSRHVPPPLEGRSVTPSVVAKACGEGAYEQWCEVLSSNGHMADTLPVNIEWGNGYSKARYGGCECCEGWCFRDKIGSH
ncbi:ankyrin repeat-containing domain protein [Paraphoma chrysanthemicola]|nr:ankyrin repeat-containing domain protein [Paraphoma chrysanthemicola]